MIISLYAGGMTVRDIQHHLGRVYGTDISHDTISKITDEVLDEVKASDSTGCESPGETKAVAVSGTWSDPEVRRSEPAAPSEGP